MAMMVEAARTNNNLVLELLEVLSRSCCPCWPNERGGPPLLSDCLDNAAPGFVIEALWRLVAGA